MNRALWLLLGLQMRGWLRSLTRRLGTVRGAVMALVGLAAFVLWLTSVFLLKRSPKYTSSEILEYGPAVLLIYCLFNVLSNTTERGVYFSPGEVNFLFPAPFGRRELLAYKIAVSFIFTLPSALFMTFVFQIYAHSFLAAFVGILLVLQFMQLFAMALNLAASAVETRLFTVGRRAAAAAAVVLAAAIAWQVGLAPGQGDVEQWLRKAIHTDVWQAVSTPLRYFFEAFLSENLWPDLAWNAVAGAGGGPGPRGAGLRPGRAVHGGVGVGQRPHLRPAPADAARRAGGGARRQGAFRLAHVAVVGRRRADLLAAVDHRHARGGTARPESGDPRRGAGGRGEHGRGKRAGCSHDPPGRRRLHDDLPDDAGALSISAATWTRWRC